MRIITHPPSDDQTSAPFNAKIKGTSSGGGGGGDGGYTIIHYYIRDGMAAQNMFSSTATAAASQRPCSVNTGVHGHAPRAAHAAVVVDVHGATVVSNAAARARCEQNKVF